MKKFLTLLLLGFFSLNIHANSCPGQFDPASGICQFQGNNGELVQYNIAPPQGHTAPPKKVIHTTIIHKASKYGALAWDKKTNMVAGAQNANSLSEAKKAAIQQCGKKGCKVITWVRNGCIAAVTGKKGNLFRLFKAVEPPGNAEQTAMKQCKTMGASNCQILIPEACSIPDGMYN